MILLDSSLIVAFSNKVDANHRKSVEIMKRIDDDEFGTGIITDYIFDESVTVAMARSGNLTKATSVSKISARQ